MPAYMVAMRNQSGDMFLEDPALTLQLSDGWATFTDGAGICLAVPREHVATIQRIDGDPQDAVTEG